MEKIIDALKLILEKHLIPTVLSLVLAGVVYLATPEDHWIMVKLSETGFYLMCAGITFLVIQLIIFVFKCIQEKTYETSENNRFKQLEERDAMEALWSFVDHLGEEDRDVLYEFLKNGNSKITRPGGWYSPESILNDRDKVKSRVVYKGHTPINEYVLDERFYNTLKYSQAKYGRICHFQDPEIIPKK